MAMWHYVGERDKVGPIDDEEIRHLIRSGAIARDTLVWRPGFDNWMEAANVLSPVFGEIEPMLSPKRAGLHIGNLTFSDSAWLRVSLGFLCAFALFIVLAFF